MTATLSLTSADGTPLLVEDTGHGTPLILVHGGLNTTRIFDRVLPDLSEHHRCLALGRRGYGQSGSSTTHSFEREAEDVAAVLAVLDEPAHLLGHSTGAIVVLVATAAHQDRVRSLVLYEPPLPIGRPHSGRWIAAVETAVGRGDNEEATLIGLRDGIGFSPEQVRRLQADQGWPARIALVPAWIREVRTVEALPLGVDRFAPVGTPTLLLRGSQTQAHHTEATDALHGVLARSEIRILDKQGHTALLLAPELVCATVLPFLANVTSS